MSNIKSISLAELATPPGMEPETTYAVDGHIETHDGREVWLPFITERGGRTDAQLEQAAREYLSDKGEAAFPYIEPEPVDETPEA